MRIDVRELAGQATLVLTPDRHYSAGRERLEQLRVTGKAASSIDWAAIDAVKARDVRVFLFRGTSDDGSGSWGFADDLSRDEAEELGHRLVQCQYASWLEMMRHGIVSFLHVEWGMREVLMLERGRERVVESLRFGEGAFTAAERALRIWLFERACSFMHTSLEDVAHAVLPSIAGLLERRVDQARRLLVDLDGG